MCRSESAFIVMPQHHWGLGMLEAAATGQKWVIYIIACLTNLTPSYAAMVQASAAKLHPFNLLRRKRYVATQMAIRGICSDG